MYRMFKPPRFVRSPSALSFLFLTFFAFFTFLIFFTGTLLVRRTSYLPWRIQIRPPRLYRPGDGGYIHERVDVVGNKLAAEGVLGADDASVI